MNPRAIMTENDNKMRKFNLSLEPRSDMMPPLRN